MTLLVGEALAAAAPQASRGRLIRIIDATTVPKAGRMAKKGNKLWRIHSAFDLPGERFGFFELTDQYGGETLDRIPVVKGEIRIADRAYLQPDRIAGVLDRALTSWCAPGGGTPAGSTATASRSIFSPASAKRRTAG